MTHPNICIRNPHLFTSLACAAAISALFLHSSNAQPGTAPPAPPKPTTPTRPARAPRAPQPWIVTAPLENEVTAKDRYVPIKLDDWVNTEGKLPLGAGRVEVEGVPFQLVNKANANVFWPGEAGWSEWQKDPKQYQANYDKVPSVRTQEQPVVQIPVADYEAVYLLAATDNDTKYSPVVSFRIGAKESAQRAVYAGSTPEEARAARGHVKYHDFSAVVPRFNQAGGANVVKTIPTAAGNVFVVRVPLGQAFAQDFKERRAFDVEITKEIRLSVTAPDANRYQYRPLGLPSGVHIFGLTFARAPIQMEVTSDQPGHVFNEPATPTFKVALHGLEGAPMPAATIEASATDFYGNVTKAAPQSVKAVPEATINVPVKTSKRGWHRIVVQVKDAAGREMLRRETTFAVLAPDTRKFRRESPFGTWDFWGGHYTPDNAEVLGPLYVKAGLRYGMFKATKEELQKYDIIRGGDPKAAGRNSPEKAIATRVAQDHEWEFFKRFLVFHENAISGPHIMRPPTAFSGQEYKFNAKEQANFDGLWKHAMEQGQDVRRIDPKIDIYFGNGNVHLLEEFLKRKFPRELFDSRGNEAGSFMRMPETQPLDFASNNASLWMDRKVLDHYGYNDVPLRQCYEMGYPCTNPGNLSLATQANYIVRHGMHSMAWKIPVIRFGEISDPGNSYYHSNWGAAGLLESKPEINPKPSYVAVATMTQALDGATFSRVIPTGSSVVYAFEFKGKDNALTTVLWTLRGKRRVALNGVGEDAYLVDMMGNNSALTLQADATPVVISETVALAGLRRGRTERSTTIEVSENPVYFKSKFTVTSIIPGAATYDDVPGADAKPVVISPLDRLTDWNVEQGKNAELEIYNFLNPRKKGNFEYKEVASFEGRNGALSVTPKLPAPGPETYQMYSVLRHKNGIAIPGQPTGIGVWANGNGGWGRVIWELEDAKGQRWISIGQEQAGEPNPWMADFLSKEEFANLKSANLSAWNADDCWQRSYINFDGWRYISFPLPGNYPGEGYHWPYAQQWRCQAKDGAPGDGVVAYPLKLTKLVVTMPEKVLYGTDYRPVARPEIYLKDLTVTYTPVEQAFVDN